jgi:hypothetical protein
MTEITELVLDHRVEDGFYSWENDTLNFAPNFVQWPDGETIQRAEKDNYDYPFRGYYWFNSRQQALKFFNKPDPNIDPTLPHLSDVFYPDTKADVIGPFPDPETEVEVLIKPDPYEPDGPEPTLGLAYDPGNPPAYADDIDEDPYVPPPPWAV